MCLVDSELLCTVLVFLIVAPESCLTQVGARCLPAHRRRDSGHEQNSAGQQMLKLNSEGPTELNLSPELSSS